MTAASASGCRAGRGALVAGSMAVLFKLWLVSAQTVQAVGEARHDDWLFVKLASALLRGQWLGTYDEITLAKGPFYSMFIAGSFALGVPLFTAQHLLYVAACALLVTALRTWVPHRGARLAIFVVMLFNPVTYDSSAHLRVLRQNLVPSLSLMILAGLIGMHVARHASEIRRLVPWALLAGLSLAAFWLTREDAPWILPSIALPWSATAWLTWREARPHRAARMAILALPAGLLVAALAAVSSLNWIHYGVFTTCEFRHPDFKAAYGALVGVESETWHPHVPVPREARERIYAASPAFTELRPYLESSLSDGWASAAAAHLASPPVGRELGGGWFVWALREAVGATEHGRSGGQAMSFYSRLAEEVNAALGRGDLKGSGGRSGFSPPMRSEHLEPFFDGIVRAVTAIAMFDGLTVTPRPSIGPREPTIVIADLTRARLSPLPGEPVLHFHQRVLDHVRLPVLHGIGAAYQTLGPWMGVVGAAAWLLACVQCLWNRRFSYPAVLGTGVLGSCIALAAGVTMIEITSFPAIIPMYLTGAYGYWLAFLVLSALALGEMQVSRRPQTRAEGTA